MRPPEPALPVLCSADCDISANCDFQSKHFFSDEPEDDGKPSEPLPEVVHEDYPVKDSPEDVRLSIEQKFLLEMPDDFYDLWDLCTKLNKEKPEGKFNLISVKVTTL